MKQIFIILFTLVSTYILGQDYLPFVEEGKVWYEETDYFVLDCARAVYRLEGDTIVNGEKWTKLYKDYYLSVDGINTAKGGDCQFVQTSYVAALQEKDKQVRAIMAGEEEAGILYDFSLNIGDKILTLPDSKASKKVLRLDRITVQTICGLERRCYHLLYEADEDGVEQEKMWIEGIGSVNGGTNGFFTDYWYTNIAGNLTYRELIGCTLNGKRIYGEDTTGLIKDDKVWVMKYYGQDMTLHTEELRINGDDVINGLLGYRLEQRLDGGEWKFIGLVNSLHGGWNRYAFMDAGSGINERIYSSGNENAYQFFTSNQYGLLGGLISNQDCIFGKDCITSCNIDYKRYKIAPAFDNESNVYGYWIEGIGFSTGFLKGFNWKTLNKGLALLQCYEDGVLIYEQNDNGVYKNGVPTNIDRIKNEHAASAMYNLQGCKVTSPQRHGIVIRDGKKIVQ